MALAHLPNPLRLARGVTVSIEFGNEKLTIEVVVPQEPDEKDVHECAIEGRKCGR